MSHEFENPVDTMNRQIVLDIVNKHFYLGSHSRKVFEESLFNPVIDPIFRDMIGNDLRARFPIKIEDLESGDSAWILFKKRFGTFIAEYNISYLNFVEGKVLVDKNEIKIFKLLKEFYFRSNENLMILINKDMLGSVPFRSTPEEVDYYVDRLIDNINNTRLPKEGRELSLVLSVNFVDWFLCSTKNSWGSCLNLDTKNCETYWAGLPGLVADSNRAMLYLTNGDKKNYRGITVDKVNSRTWLLIDNRDKIRYVRYYPSQLIPDELASKIIDKNLVPISSGYESKHSFPMIFFENGKSSFIYQDGTHSKLSGDKDGWEYMKLSGGRGGFHSFNREIGDFSNEPLFYCECGLSEVIKSGKNLGDFQNENEFSCEACGCGMREEQVFWHEEYAYCECCYDERYTSCNNCGHSIHRDEACFTDYESYCQDCFDELCVSCYNCGTAIEWDEAVKVDDDYYCEKCSRKLTKN
jgi:hypothetical protein